MCPYLTYQTLLDVEIQSGVISSNTGPLFFFSFPTGSPYLAQVGLEFVSLLPYLIDRIAGMQQYIYAARFIYTYRVVKMAQ